MGISGLTEGILFDIQGFSVHDGPGCRTLVFLKGCSMRCKWCSNPEGLHPFPEPLYSVSKCIGDEMCTEACQLAAITITDSNPLLYFDRAICSRCTSFNCISACCSGSLKKGGYSISIDRLMQIIQRDRQYWGDNGGITLTGGEPFLQPEFAKNLLGRCHRSYIHTAVETCGNIPWSGISPSLQYLDWIFFDLKHMDSEKHYAMTGSSNSLILSNAVRLSKEFGGRLLFRMPVIPGFNDDESNNLATAEFLNSLGCKEINILPLHHLGREKYPLTGMEYYTGDFRAPDSKSLVAMQSFFLEAGITCYIGSETPF